MSTLQHYPRVESWFLRIVLQFLDRADRRTGLVAICPRDVLAAILTVLAVVRLLQRLTREGKAGKRMAEAQPGELVSARAEHLEPLWSIRQLPSRWNGIQLKGPAEWFSLQFYRDCAFYILLRFWRVGVS